MEISLITDDVINIDKTSGVAKINFVLIDEEDFQLVASNPLPKESLDLSLSLNKPDNISDQETINLFHATDIKKLTDHIDNRNSYKLTKEQNKYILQLNDSTQFIFHEITSPSKTQIILTHIKTKDSKTFELSWNKNFSPPRLETIKKEFPQIDDIHYITSFSWATHESDEQWVTEVSKHRHSRSPNSIDTKTKIEHRVATTSDSLSIVHEHITSTVHFESGRTKKIESQEENTDKGLDVEFFYGKEPAKSKESITSISLKFKSEHQDRLEASPVKDGNIIESNDTLTNPRDFFSNTTTTNTYRVF
ncbi:hypothetical protein HU751_012970 [Pseudomonas sp. BW13M1]|uniref:Uncharacterized protein n=1 Tax=Pseudomonas peradeniyensis TaxID=2745488 RepID=A0A923JYI8_9PSED|nr:hypothetical protein [Pseudomonas peradeniyensis]MBV4505758.1 hypothetical protein [Pseudomonas peradeniyensis]